MKRKKQNQAVITFPRFSEICVEKLLGNSRTGMIPFFFLTDDKILDSENPYLMGRKLSILILVYNIKRGVYIN